MEINHPYKKYQPYSWEKEHPNYFITFKQFLTEYQVPIKEIRNHYLNIKNAVYHYAEREKINEV